MAGYALAGLVVLADTLLLVGAYQGGLLPLWAVPAYALAATLVIGLRGRSAAAALVAALALATLAGGGWALLVWAAYQAGRALRSRTDLAMTVGAALGGLAVRLVTAPAALDTVPRLVSAYAVFVALPLLVGRYLAQHRRLVSTLDEHNRRLRRERALLAERERLRERLRIARDMHDSLGHRLSLVSIQAAALEVSTLPPEQRQAVTRLAGAARGALDELYEVIGALRGEERSGPGLDAIDGLVAEFRGAGVPVAPRVTGRPRELSAVAGQAAYRVVEEGLTNAAKHAPGRPVEVNVAWEPDALLVTVVNTVGGDERDDDGDDGGGGGGHGLAGLRERLDAVGGLLDHRVRDGQFRLVAMLPALPPAPPDDAGPPEAGRARTVALGLATAALMLVLLPASVLVGIG